MNSLRGEHYKMLAYIHSNRTITIELFKEKFFPGKTYQRAWQLIGLLKRKNYLFSKHENKFKPAVFGLTQEALSEMVSKGFLLAKRVRPVRIYFGHEAHHEAVTRLRIKIEGDPAFSDVFWLSDFEIKQGMSKEAKWKFRELETAEERLEFIKTWKKIKYKRDPDGYFDALVGNDEVESYVLEYEHQEYSRTTILGMINGLEDSFRGAGKLVVCKTPEREDGFRKILVQTMDSIKGRRFDYDKWMTSSIEKATTQPFKTAFKTLNKD